MKRRSFLQASLSAGTAAALGAPHLSGLAQQTVTLKFHTFMAPMSNVWLLMHKPWMDKVEKESGGRARAGGPLRRAWQSAPWRCPARLCP